MTAGRNLNLFIGILGIGVALFGCATNKQSSDTGAMCIPQETIDEVLQNAEPFIDTLASAKTMNQSKVETRLVRASCNLHSYERSGFRIIIFRNPNSLERKVQASFMQPKVMELDPKSCLGRALEDIHALRLDFSDRLIQMHNKQYGWLWEDPDIGPVKWLNCTSQRNTYWYDSLAVFLHELSHEVRGEQCLFNSGNNETTCWKLPDSLPLRGIAKIEDFKNYGSKNATELDKIQKLYLTDTNQPPFFLFDELQAYTITSKVYSSVVRVHGIQALRPELQGARLPNYLPLFMLYSARYLHALKEKSPQSYTANFNSCSLNTVALNSLKREARSAYLDWLRALHEAQSGPLKLEAQLFREYEALDWQLSPSTSVQQCGPKLQN